MKAIWMSATVGLALCGSALAKSELEILRDRCAEQDKRIRQLEDENGRLRGAAPAKPEHVTAPQETTSVAAAKTEARTYTVTKGDTLERISRKTGVNVATLSQLNELKPSTVIHPGLTLKLPAAKETKEAAPPTSRPSPAPESKPRETAMAAAKTEPASAAKTISNPAPAPAPAMTSKAGSKSEAKSPAPVAVANGTKPVIRSITIQSPVTYSDFASKQGTTPERLNELNGLSLGNSTLLAVGSELYVPVQP